MRHTNLFICSTAHVPLEERTEIDALIDSAERERFGGRLIIDHPVLAIEAHRCGFFVATAIVGDGAECPIEVSAELWALLATAFHADAA